MTEASASIPKHCRGIRRDGQRCAAPVMNSSAYCFGHDPDRAADRTDARRRGGRNKASAIRLRGLVPPRLVSVYDQLETALADVLSGDLDPKQGTAAAAISRAMVAVLTSGELEERVRTLEGSASGEPPNPPRRP